MMDKHIVKNKHQCVHCNGDVTTERILFIEVTDFHCANQNCGYKDMRVIEHPTYSSQDVEELMNKCKEVYQQFNFNWNLAYHEKEYKLLYELCIIVARIKGVDLEKLRDEWDDE